ncbi:hypothetical protein V1478_007347 [Vespula squamosa]|uniref:Uncharacterized protein n=1 Tax=Vespula squamosa TaxID=30214 RepID=A0ABD2B2V6_VESSQ
MFFIFLEQDSSLNIDPNLEFQGLIQNQVLRIDVYQKAIGLRWFIRWFVGSTSSLPVRPLIQANNTEEDETLCRRLHDSAISLSIFGYTPTVGQRDFSRSRTPVGWS